MFIKDRPCLGRWARPGVGKEGGITSSEACVTGHVSGPKPAVLSVIGALSEVTSPSDRDLSWIPLGVGGLRETTCNSAVVSDGAPPSAGGPAGGCASQAPAGGHTLGVTAFSALSASPSEHPAPGPSVSGTASTLPCSPVVSVMSECTLDSGSTLSPDPPAALCPQGLYSSVACPGTMLTNMTYGILPSFVWTLLMPIIWLVSAPHAFALCT